MKFLNNNISMVVAKSFIIDIECNPAISMILIDQIGAVFLLLLLSNGYVLTHTQTYQSLIDTNQIMKQKSVLNECTIKLDKHHKR